MKPRERLDIISNLSTMLTAGIPILEATESLLPESRGNIKKFLILLRDSLNEGKPMSFAMSQMPSAFDPVTNNIIKAAEESGTLEDTLKDIETNMKSELEFRSQLKASLAYPIFIFAVFLGILLLMLGFVVPRISKVFSGLRVDLPETTRLLITTSDLMIENYRTILAIIAVFILSVALLVHFKRRTMYNIMLQLPMLKKLGREIDLARFTRSMSLLLKSGLAIGEALELSKSVMTKREMRSMADDMIESITQGKTISEGIEPSKNIIPILMYRLISTAERSGSLESSMQNLSEHFQTQVSQRLKNITTLIEPIMIVVIGVLVGGMMLAIIAPIYGLINNVQAR